MSNPLTVADLNNGAIDIRDIAKLVNSGELTLVNRDGETRKTWAGIEQELGAEYAQQVTGANRIASEEARDAAIEAAATAQASSNVKTYLTKALMEADTSQPAGTRAVVTNDPSAPNNGYFTWNGASWLYGSLQPASTADVQSLQGLIKPGDNLNGRVLTFLDKRRFAWGHLFSDGAMRSRGFAIEPSGGGDGLIIKNKWGWVLFNSKWFTGTSKPTTPNWAGKRFLLFGDSITQTGNPAGGNFGTGVRENWPIYAQSMLQMADMKNYAVSGAAFRHQGQTDWQKIDFQILQAIANAETPQVIVFSAATNDQAVGWGTYAGAMGKATIDDLDLTLTSDAMRWAFLKCQITWPGVPIFYVNPLQRADVETSDRLPLLDLGAQMAGRYCVTLIDAHRKSGIVKDFEVWNALGRYLIDGLHPITAGQVLEAQLVVRDIKSHFAY